uniref:Uncharacterized protein n=1 Tax=Opuntia streptacantha TaxID=393608 RepID=A0A7C8ZLA2_OPUST
MLNLNMLWLLLRHKLHSHPLVHRPLSQQVHQPMIIGLVSIMFLKLRCLKHLQVQIHLNLPLHSCQFHHQPRHLDQLLVMLPHGPQHLQMASFPHQLVVISYLLPYQHLLGLLHKWHPSHLELLVVCLQHLLPMVVQGIGLVCNISHSSPMLLLVRLVLRN